MKVFHLRDVPITVAHDNLKRQRFIAPGDLKSKTQTVNYVELAYNESYTPHIHPDCEECFFVIDGQAKAEITRQVMIIRKGDFLVVEPGELHVFTNTHRKTFKYFQFRILI